MTEKKETDNTVDPNQDDVVHDEEKDANIIFSEIHANQSPLKNIKIISFLDVLIPDIRNHLSSFLGTKVQIALESVNLCNTKENAFVNKAAILTSFHFTPVSQYGVLCYSFNLLNIIINLLYGSSELNETSRGSLGKTGIKLSENLTLLFLSSIQQALQELLPVTLKAELTTDQVKIITNKFLPAYYFELTFKINIQENEGNISIIIPETVFDFYNRDNLPEKAQTDKELRLTAENKLRKEIIESSITLIACLQDIKMKINDVLNLKSGDLIPIDDPSHVCLFHNNKPLFKGTAGQADSNRVIKIEHSV